MSRVQFAVLSVFNDEKNAGILFNITKKQKKGAPTAWRERLFIKALLLRQISLAVKKLRDKNRTAGCAAQRVV